MKKLYSITFITIVFGLLTIPMIQHIRLGDQKLSSENRNLNQKPFFPNNINDLKDYTQQIDSYLADQFGFRTQLISLANKIRYYVFNEATSKQLSIGKNKFFYLNSHSAISPNSLIYQVCDIKPLSTESLTKIPIVVDEFIKNFQNVGIKTALAIIPTKSRIYPENLPNQLASLCLKKPETTLDSILRTNKQIIYYPIDQMKKWKDDFQVYLPKHFHWNGRLAYEIADDIIQTVFNLKPEFDVTPTRVQVLSDLNHHFEGVEFLQASLSYSYKNYNVTECKGTACSENFTKMYNNGNSFNFTKPSHTNRKLLIISDSFGAEVAEHFIRAFDEVTLVNINNLSDSEQAPFYQYILKTTQATHLLYLIHDGGIEWQTNKLEDLLNKFNLLEINHDYTKNN
jgi:hypothetical protein